MSLEPHFQNHLPTARDIGCTVQVIGGLDINGQRIAGTMGVLAWVGADEGEPGGDYFNARITIDGCDSARWINRKFLRLVPPLQFSEAELSTISNALFAAASKFCGYAEELALPAVAERFLKQAQQCDAVRARINIEAGVC